MTNLSEETVAYLDYLKWKLTDEEVNELVKHIEQEKEYSWSDGYADCDEGENK